MAYEVKALRNGIQKAYDNIKLFEDAIAKEHDTILEYKNLIKLIEAKNDSEVRH